MFRAWIVVTDLCLSVEVRTRTDVCPIIPLLSLRVDGRGLTPIPKQSRFQMRTARHPASHTFLFLLPSFVIFSPLMGENKKEGEKTADRCLPIYFSA